MSNTFVEHLHHMQRTVSTWPDWKRVPLTGGTTPEADTYFAHWMGEELAEWTKERRNAFKCAHPRPDLMTPRELRHAVDAFCEAYNLPLDQVECIEAAFTHGPLDDGDIPSKPARDLLIASGHMAKVVVKGQDGFNALTHKGRDAYRVIEALK